MTNRYQKPVMGCLLGAAVGDALGLPYKRLSRNKIYQFHTPIQGHNLVLNKGMFSDDTEHICMTAQSLIVSDGDPQKFARDLAWRLKFWLLGFPMGISWATLGSCLKLWIGFSPQQSGINSAGNSAAIRSAIIGVCYGEDPPQLVALVKASTIITHNSYKAELGAISIAVAAYMASTEFPIQPQKYQQTLKEFLTHFSLKLADSKVIEFLSLIDRACLSAEKNESGLTFADSLNNRHGVSGGIYHTVPIVIQVWLRYQDRYSQGIKEILYLGGDTDTAAAILGGIIGASVGISGIRQQWLDDIVDFPRSIKWIKALSKRLALSRNKRASLPALPIAFYLIPLRNLIFLIIILFHIFYRLLPF